LGDNGGVVSEKSVDIGAKAIRKFFNVAVHNYDISFWEDDFCRSDGYDHDFEDEDLDDDIENGDDIELPDTPQNESPDDRVLAWYAKIDYKNETEQTIKGYEYIPDPVIELFDDFNDYFDDGALDDEVDEDNQMFPESECY
jgi:hypothetical protein